MDTMDRVFICPECGRQVAYRPEECVLFTRYRVAGEKVKAFQVRLVYCLG